VQCVIKHLYNGIGEMHMFNKILEWLSKPQISEIEYYIASRNPQTTADVEQLIKEFNYKRKLQCF